MNAGTTASDGRRDSVSMSSGFFTVLSMYSRNSASPIAADQADQHRQRDVARLSRPRRTRRNHRRIDNADIARLQAREMPASFSFCSKPS